MTTPTPTLAQALEIVDDVRNEAVACLDDGYDSEDDGIYTEPGSYIPCDFLQDLIARLFDLDDDDVDSPHAIWDAAGSILGDKCPVWWNDLANMI